MAGPFPWCGPIPLPQGATGASGWSSCFIDRADNRQAGSRPGAFYSDNRIIGGHAFDVVLIEI